MPILFLEESTIKLLSSKNPRAYLGGLPKNGTNKINGATAYGSLPRPPSLPPPRFSFQDKGVEKAYLNIWNGDFTLAWFVYRGSTLIVTARVDDESVPERFREVPLHGILLNEESEAGVALGTIQGNTADCHFSEEFATAQSEKQRFALSHRILHHFIRRFGARFSPYWLEIACRPLLGHSKTKIREAIDVLMIKADVAINLQLGCLKIGKALTEVGEYLEADGRFLEAARVYQEVAESCYVSWSNDTDFRSYFGSQSEVATLWGFCALAFKRADDFESSEKAYIKALHFSRVHSGGDHRWDLNKHIITEILLNAMSMYSAFHAWANGKPQELELSKMELTFEALLFAAGLRPGWQFILSADFMRDGAMFQESLKPPFKTCTGAKQALILATQTQSVESFRSVILSCSDPSYRLLNLGYEEGRTPEDRKKADKQCAREVFGDRYPRSINLDTCNNPACGAMALQNGSTVAFKVCPCKRVCYCQKSCQVAHWKQHKLVCLYHAKRKSEKKNASNGKK